MKKGIEIPKEYSNTSPYSGLTYTECTNGIIKIIQNIERLLKEAENNIDNKELATLYLIAAIEETSKVRQMIYHLCFPMQGQAKFKKYFTNKLNSFFSSHSKKQKNFLSYYGDNPEDSFIKKNLNLKSYFKFNKNSQNHLEMARKQSLYVDIIAGKFLTPKEAFAKNKYMTKNFKPLFKAAKAELTQLNIVFKNDPVVCKYSIALIRWTLSDVKNLSKLLKSKNVKMLG